MQSMLPQLPSVTPLALSGAGVLESHIAQVGLRILHEETVRLDYRFQDFEDFWSHGKELGGIKLIAHTVGEANVRQEAYQSALQSIQPNGELVMHNTYRLVILTPKPHG